MKRTKATNDRPKNPYWHIIHRCGYEGNLTACGIKTFPQGEGCHIVGNMKYVNCPECIRVLTVKSKP